MRRRVLPLGAALAAALALAGCALGPRYHPAATPAAGRGPFVSATPGIADADAPPPDWWRLYQDPALDRLVGEALANNADLKVAAANLARARGVLQEARAGRFPATQVQAGATYGKSATANLVATLDGTRARPGWLYDGQFDVSYEVDLFGRISRTIEAARADAEAVQAAEDVARITAAAETARAYADACGYAAQARVARESVDLTGQLFDLTTRQRDLGAVSDFEVASAGAVFDQAKAALPPLEAGQRSSLFELAVLTGHAPEEVSAEAAGCQATPQLAQLLPTGDGAALLRRRPDVRQADRALEADTARIGVAMADLFPTVSLNGSAAQAGANGAQLTSSRGFSFAVGPLITWSFPNLLVASARVKEARAQASSSLAGFDSVVLQALKEVEQALTTYNGELQRRAALAGARDQSATAYKLAQIQFQDGAIGFPDLLQSERSLVIAENQLAASDQALVDDQVAVFKALGGGWEQAPAVTLPVVR